MKKFTFLLLISVLFFSCSVAMSAKNPNSAVQFRSSANLELTYKAIKKYLNEIGDAGVGSVHDTFKTKKYSKIVTRGFKLKYKDPLGNKANHPDFYYQKIEFLLSEDKNGVLVKANFTFFLDNPTFRIKKEKPSWSLEAEEQKNRYVKLLNSFFDEL